MKQPKVPETSPGNSRPKRRHGGRIRFEHSPSRVMFDKSSGRFVVTWSKCGKPAEERMASKKDPGKWMPSVYAMAVLYDRGCIGSDEVIAAAESIGSAWGAGDRYLLDTDDAKRSAELVSDLSKVLSSSSCDSSCGDRIADVRQAMRKLVDSIAMARLASEPESSFEEAATVPVLVKAVGECMGLDGFSGWSGKSQRKRLMYCLGRKERTRVAYTLISAITGTGCCPLLPVSYASALRWTVRTEMGAADGELYARAGEFFSIALSKIREIRRDGADGIAELARKQMLDRMHSGQSK